MGFRSKFFTFSLGCLLLAIIYFVVLFFSFENTKDLLIAAETTLGQLKSEALKFENQRINEAISAKTIVNDLAAETLEWSKIVRAINQVVPERQGEPIVNILSYSGNQDGSITLSVKTSPSSGGPYLDIATFIKALDQDSNFSDSFVPSIASGQDDEGLQILSFSLSTSFIDEKLVEGRISR